MANLIVCYAILHLWLECQMQCSRQTICSSSAVVSTYICMYIVCSGECLNYYAPLLHAACFKCNPCEDPQVSFCKSHHETLPSEGESAKWQAATGEQQPHDLHLPAPRWVWCNVNQKWCNRLAPRFTSDIRTLSTLDSHSNCHLVQGGSPLPPNQETRNVLFTAYSLCSDGAYEAQKPAMMRRHPSSTSFDIPHTAVPRVLGTSQDPYAPPSPSDVALEELWPKSFEVRGGALSLSLLSLARAWS